MAEILEYVNEHIFPSMFVPLVTDDSNLEQLATCPSCREGKLKIRFSKYGPFLACDKYTEIKCDYKLNMAALGKKELKDPNQSV